MKHIALILGHEAPKANDYKPYELSKALEASGADMLVAVGGPGYFNQQSVSGVLKDISQRHGPRLVFGILNGRSAAPGLHPQNINGNGNDLKEMMDTIIKGASQSGDPVDVFLLLASTPRFIHGYAQGLPRGSTIVAIETAPGSQHSRHLWATLQQAALHQNVQPGARNMLLTTMLAADGTYGLPEIAVSGQPRVDVRDVWDELVNNGKVMPAGHKTLSDACKTELKGISRYMALPQADALEYAMLTINNQPQYVKPLDNQYYACALASLWQKFFVPAQVAPMPVIAPPALPPPPPVQVVHSAPPPAAPAPSGTAAGPHTRPRLTNSQIGGLYKPGQPVHKQHPTVVKRLLRKG